jgi:hypothetical protein
MPRPRTEALELDQRRAAVAALYLQGRYQWEIGQALGIDQGTVSRDLKAIRERWKASALRDFDALKARELERIDHLERTYWEAWEQSKRPRETTSTEKTNAARGGRLKAALKKEAREGSPEFLKGVQWCITKRCELLGLDAPKKVAPTSPDGLEEYGTSLTDEQRLVRIVALLDRAREKRAGRAPPPGDAAPVEALPGQPPGEGLPQPGG